jgi:transcriptional repressor NrdR
MRCPRCDGNDNRVVDTRTSRGGRAVRRRRECLACGERFTTYEYVEARTLMILKRDGSAEEFDRDKLVRSLRLACAKRPVSASEIERLADEIEDDLSGRAGVEVPSSLVGEMVMERLKPLDRVAYVRFASVYRNFQDIDEFQHVVDDLNARQRREAQARHQQELPLESTQRDG